MNNNYAKKQYPISKKEEIADTSHLELLDKVLIQGDLSGLTVEQRLSYVKEICKATGIDVRLKPFEFIVLNGKLRLYALKGATDQLRKVHSISITDVEEKEAGDLYRVAVHAATPDGRTDCDIGVVKITGLKGDDAANAMMKAYTKAKRRVTLSICGLGLLDESEIETIPDAHHLKDITTANPKLEVFPGPKSLYEGAQISIEPIKMEDNKQAFLLKARTALNNALTLHALKIVYEEIKQDEKFKDIELKKAINKHVAECKAKIEHLNNA